MESAGNFENKYETQKMKSSEQVKLEYEIFEINRFLESVEAPIFNSEGDKLSIVERIKAYKEDNIIKLKWNSKPPKNDYYNFFTWRNSLISMINRGSAMYSQKLQVYADTIEVNSKLKTLIDSLNLSERYKIYVNDELDEDVIMLYQDKHNPIQVKITVLNY